MRSLRTLGVLAVVALLGLPASAHATFPGANGKIAFMYSDQHIYVANADGSNLTNLTGFTSTSDTEPAWAANGIRIAYVGAGNPADPPAHIFFIQANGAEWTQVTHNPSNQNDYSPSWSPDGKKIAYSNSVGFCSGGCSSTIKITTIPGVTPAGQTTPCCSGGGYAGEPSWSPDGKKIVFTRSSFPDTVPWDLWTMDVDGGNLTRICCDGSMNAISPDWSPDGQSILFQDIGGDHGFWRINPDGSGLTEVYAPPAADESGGQWSPDGTRIVFAERPAPDLGPAIYTMKLDGSDRVRVTPPPADPNAGYAFPSWQPIPPNPYSGYPRPRGAGPFQTFLVPAYQQCTVSNSTHGAPLAFASCNPPQQASSFLTVGTPDSNGQGAKSIGVVKFAVRPGTPTTNPDVAITASVTDVRNRSDLSDYGGSLQAVSDLRVTDYYNSPDLQTPATTEDFSFPFDVPCATTADTTIGSTCAVQTTANSIVPGMVPVSHQRMVTQIGQVRVYDGGADGQASTQGDNTLFLIEGIFIP